MMIEKLSYFINRIIFLFKLNRRLKKFGAKAWPITNYNQGGIILQIQYGKQYTQMYVGIEHYKDKKFMLFIVQEIEGKRIKDISKKNGIERYHG